MNGFNTLRKKHLLVRFGLPLLAVAMLAFALISTLPSAPAKIPAPDVAPPESVFSHQVAGVGVTEPKSESIAVGVNIPGIVTQVSVKVGDSVHAGDVLFVVDDRAARAALASAKVQAADARAQLALYNQVSDKRAISSDDLNRRRFASELASARVRELETELERLQVKAPIDGTLLRVSIRPGEYAQAGVLPTPLMLLGDISTMHVRVEVDESDALLVAPEAKATGRLRGYPGKEAALTFVRKEYYVRPKRSLSGDGNERVDTRVQEIVYAFDNASIGTYVGQQMDVYIEAEKR